MKRARMLFAVRGAVLAAFFMLLTFQGATVEAQVSDETTADLLQET